jgi:thiamine-phosphate pyrophosphorylase
MLICITNRKLCKDDFLDRINQIAAGKPQAIVLREKDLNLSEYEKLAVEIDKICKKNQVALIINQNIEVAVHMKHQNIQLSMDDLRKYKSEIKKFENIGASVHSVNEVEEAQKLGATYLVAGHIFLTDCKKGVAPRGLTFLKEVCDAATIPVFAIGGITKERFERILQTGAAGGCIMSEAMTCEKPERLAGDYENFPKNYK